MGVRQRQLPLSKAAANSRRGIRGRRSKRLQDLADAQSLLENNPSLLEELSSAKRAILDQLPR